MLHRYVLSFGLSQREQVQSIKDALQYISHPESVQITSPTRPGVVIDANQHTLIESFPSVLILHLKRFHYDTKVGDVVKIGKQVTYTPELEIGAGTSNCLSAGVYHREIEFMFYQISSRQHGEHRTRSNISSLVVCSLSTAAQSLRS